MTKSDFITGKSCPINSELMRIFLQCHIVEQTGHGVPKIVEKYGANAYEFGTSMITVTIPFNKKHFIDSQNVAQESSKINLELKIIVLIKYNPKITRKDIATILDKSVKTIEREIKKSNEIYFIGSSKNGHWEII